MISHQKYTQLVNELNIYAKEYYQDDTPSISDYEYDQKYHQLIEFETSNPLLVDATSPTQRVGEKRLTGFNAFKHSELLPSLSNVFQFSELDAFIKRVHKALECHQASFSIEPKVDGLAVALLYKKGKFIKGGTRGDGKVGEDITQNLKTISSLPLTLTEPIDIEVRGEVYMKKSQFETLKDQFANPRNAAAGTMRQLDTKVAKERHLNIIIYQGIVPNIPTHLEIIDYLTKLGFPTNPDIQLTTCIDQLWEYAQQFEQNRHLYDHEIDGAVIKVNQILLQKKLGTTTKYPRWATAYKFSAEEGITQLKDISIQVGRSGTLTPVAHVSPIKLSGITISHATLHNMDEINRLNIQIGDDVVIIRSGDVIPKIVRLAKQNKDSKPFRMPSHCPSCNTPIYKNPDEVAHRCPNINCPAQIKGQLRHFSSRKAMDIDGLGQEIIEQLVDKNLIKNVSDIYALTIDQLLSLDRFAKKSATNLINAINISKTKSLSNIIYGLGIPFVGESTAALLVEHYHTLSSFLNATKQELLDINGLGPKTAHEIITCLQTHQFVNQVHQLIALGVNPTQTPLSQSLPLYNKTFLITGTLQQYTRTKATTLIKEKGGKLLSSVSKNLDYLITGESPGSKLEKAKKLKEAGHQINIINEFEFDTLLNTS